jgi:NADH dehydrogenase
MSTAVTPHVVIIGAGFAGLSAAKALRRAPVHVTLVDRRNHHLFQPLLYQVATAGLNASDIASPVRRILRNQRNVEVRMAEALSIDLTRCCVLLDHGSLTYDHLIIATGASHSYFGHPEWAALAPGLKSIEDALEIRRRVLLAYELAEQEPDATECERFMTFVVVGGGPTGVELAGALAEIARTALARDFRRIDPRRARVVLVEAGPRILPSYPAELSASAERQLRRLGVDVQVGEQVTDIDARGVSIRSGRIEAHSVLWAAGVAASPLVAALGAALDRQGRARVTAQLTLPGWDNVYVVGDVALVEQEQGPVPGVAPAAIQQGRHAADRIRRQLRGETALPRPFRYRDKGSLATIGRAAAVADLGRLHFSGPVAWLVWLLVHIMALVGFRNRVLVFFEWFWSYVTYERGARLITGQPTADARTTPTSSVALPGEPVERLDPVEEASIESFPASDPPGWIGSTAAHVRVTR